MFGFSICSLLLLSFLIMAAMTSAVASSITAFFLSGPVKAVIVWVSQMAYSFAFACLMLYGNYWFFISLIIINAIFILAMSDVRLNPVTLEKEYFPWYQRVPYMVPAVFGATAMFFFFQWIA